MDFPWDFPSFVSWGRADLLRGSAVDPVLDPLFVPSSFVLLQTLGGGGGDGTPVI